MKNIRSHYQFHSSQKSSCHQFAIANPQKLLKRACGKTYLQQKTVRRKINCRQGFDLESIVMPEIDEDLLTVQLEQGAQTDSNNRLLRFESDGLPAMKLLQGAVLEDHSHYQRLRVTGDDRLRFLHNQSTNHFEGVPEPETPGAAGTGVQTAFTTPQGQLLTTALALPQSQSVLLLTQQPQPAKSSEGGEEEGGVGNILEWLNQYIFPADNVQVADFSGQTCQLVLSGENAMKIAKDIKIPAQFLSSDPGTFQLFKMAGQPVQCILHSPYGPSVPGVTFVTSVAAAAAIWRALAIAGAQSIGLEGGEKLRVVTGTPAVGREITGKLHVLEAGLFDHVSLQKGCYMGQESISKLANARFLKQQLWGLLLHRTTPSGESPTGDDVDGGLVGAAVEDVDTGEVLGVVSSGAVVDDDVAYALSTLKTRVGSERVSLVGRGVKVVTPAHGAWYGEVSSRKNACWAFAEGKGPKEQEQGADYSAGGRQDVDKEERLQQMQQALAQWQAMQAKQNTITRTELEAMQQQQQQQGQEGSGE